MNRHNGELQLKSNSIFTPLYVHLILVVFLDEVSWDLAVVTALFFTTSVGAGVGLGGRVVLLVVVNTVKGVVDL